MLNPTPPLTKRPSTAPTNKPTSRSQQSMTKQLTFFYPNNANYHAANDIPYYQANTFADETTRNGSNVKARCTTVRLVTPPS
jgi:hypothetical protein